MYTTMGDDMDWDKIWDGLDNEENWEVEKYRAPGESRVSASIGIGMRPLTISFMNTFADSPQASIKMHCANFTHKLQRLLWNMRVSKRSSST